MTREEAGFLESVCADPDSDGPRLIYADWLDEHADPRGGFIRLQIALALLPTDHPDRDGLRDLEAVHLARFGDVWAAPLRGLVTGYEFRRGFVEVVNIEARTFLRRANDLFDLAPVRHIRFLDVGSSLAAILKSPPLARLTALSIYAQYFDERLTRYLADCEFLAGLATLNLGKNRIGDRGLVPLAQAGRFPSLVELDLSGNTIGDPGMRTLAESNGLAALERLELRRNEVGRHGLATLCSSTELPRLRSIGLSLNDVGAPQEPVTRAEGAVRLAHLNLGENALQAEGIDFLAGLPGLGGLASLDLGLNEIGNAGAAALAAWAGAVGLETLRLSSNRVGDDGAIALANSAYLFRLNHLDLSDNPVHDRGAWEFVRTPSLGRLKSLALPRLGLTPGVRRALANRFPVE